jgi:hypothetical protein
MGRGHPGTLALATGILEFRKPFQKSEIFSRNPERAAWGYGGYDCRRPRPLPYRASLFVVWVLWWGGGTPVAF